MKQTNVFISVTLHKHNSMTMRIISAREIINIALNSDNVFTAIYLRRHNHWNLVIARDSRA